MFNSSPTKMKESSIGAGRKENENIGSSSLATPQPVETKTENTSDQPPEDVWAQFLAEWEDYKQVVAESSSGGASGKNCAQETLEDKELGSKSVRGPDSSRPVGDISDISRSSSESHSKEQPIIFKNVEESPRPVTTLNMPPHMKEHLSPPITTPNRTYPFLPIKNEQDFVSDHDKVTYVKFDADSLVVDYLPEGQLDIGKVKTEIQNNSSDLIMMPSHTELEHLFRNMKEGEIVGIKSEVHDLDSSSGLNHENFFIVETGTVSVVKNEAGVLLNIDTTPGTNDVSMPGDSAVPVRHKEMSCQTIIQSSDLPTRPMKADTDTVADVSENVTSSVTKVASVDKSVPCDIQESLDELDKKSNDIQVFESQLDDAALARIEELERIVAQLHSDAVAEVMEGTKSQLGIEPLPQLDNASPAQIHRPTSLVLHNATSTELDSTVPAEMQLSVSSKLEPQTPESQLDSAVPTSKPFSVSQLDSVVPTTQGSVSQSHSAVHVLTEIQSPVSQSFDSLHSEIQGSVLSCSNDVTQNSVNNLKSVVSGKSCNSIATQTENPADVKLEPGERSVTVFVCDQCDFLCHSLPKLARHKEKHVVVKAEPEPVECVRNVGGRRVMVQSQGCQASSRTVCAPKVSTNVKTETDSESSRNLQGCKDAIEKQHGDIVSDCDNVATTNFIVGGACTLDMGVSTVTSAGESEDAAGVDDYCASTDDDEVGTKDSVADTFQKNIPGQAQRGNGVKPLNMNNSDNSLGGDVHRKQANSHSTPNMNILTRLLTGSVTNTPRRLAANTITSAKPLKMNSSDNSLGVDVHRTQANSQGTPNMNILTRLLTGSVTNTQRRPAPNTITSAKPNEMRNGMLVPSTVPGTYSSGVGRGSAVPYTEHNGLQTFANRGTASFLPNGQQPMDSRGANGQQPMDSRGANGQQAIANRGYTPYLHHGQQTSANQDTASFLQNRQHAKARRGTAPNLLNGQQPLGIRGTTPYRHNSQQTMAIRANAPFLRNGQKTIASRGTAQYLPDVQQTFANRGTAPYLHDGQDARNAMPGSNSQQNISSRANTPYLHNGTTMPCLQNGTSRNLAGSKNSRGSPSMPVVVEIDDDSSDNGSNQSLNKTRKHGPSNDQGKGNDQVYGAAATKEFSTNTNQNVSIRNQQLPKTLLDMLNTRCEVVTSYPIPPDLAKSGWTGSGQTVTPNGNRMPSLANTAGFGKQGFDRNHQQAKQNSTQRRVTKKSTTANRMSNVPAFNQKQFLNLKDYLQRGAEPASNTQSEQRINRAGPANFTPPHTCSPGNQAVPIEINGSSDVELTNTIVARPDSSTTHSLIAQSTQSNRDNPLISSLPFPQNSTTSSTLPHSKNESSKESERGKRQPVTVKELLNSIRLNSNAPGQKNESMPVVENLRAGTGPSTNINGNSDRSLVTSNSKSNESRLMNASCTSRPSQGHQRQLGGPVSFGHLVNSAISSCLDTDASQPMGRSSDQNAANTYMEFVSADSSNLSVNSTKGIGLIDSSKRQYDINNNSCGDVPEELKENDGRCIGQLNEASSGPYREDSLTNSVSNGDAVAESVCGTVTVSECSTLTVSEGSTLTVSEGSTLTVSECDMNIDSSQERNTGIKKCLEEPLTRRPAMPRTGQVFERGIASSTSGENTNQNAGSSRTILDLLTARSEVDTAVPFASDISWMNSSFKKAGSGPAAAPRSSGRGLRKIFQCNYCSKNFTCFSSLEQHKLGCGTVEVELDLESGHGESRGGMRHSDSDDTIIDDDYDPARDISSGSSNEDDDDSYTRRLWLDSDSEDEVMNLKKVASKSGKAKKNRANLVPRNGQRSLEMNHDMLVTSQLNHAGHAQFNHAKHAQFNHAGNSQLDDTGAIQLNHAGNAQLNHAGTSQLDHAGNSQLNHSGNTQLNHARNSQLDHAGNSQLHHAGNSQLHHAGTTKLNHADSNQIDHPRGSIEDPVDRAQLPRVPLGRDRGRPTDPYRRLHTLKAVKLNKSKANLGIVDLFTSDEDTESDVEVNGYCQLKNPKDYWCEVCDEVLEDRSAIEDHLVAKHGYRPGAEMDPSQEICDICCRAYITKTNLLRHKIQIHGAYLLMKKQGLAKRKFVSRKKLQVKRVVSADNKTRAFLCERCDLIAAGSKEIIEHMKTHDSDASLQVDSEQICDICEAPFPNPLMVLKHKIFNHSGYLLQKRKEKISESGSPDDMGRQVSDEASPDGAEKQISKVKEANADVAETQISKEVNPNVVEQQMVVEAEPGVAQTRISDKAIPDVAEKEISKVKEANADVAETQIAKEANPNVVEQQMAVEAEPGVALPQISDEASPDAEEKQISKEACAGVANVQISKEVNPDLIQIEQQMAVETDPDVALPQISDEASPDAEEKQILKEASAGVANVQISNEANPDLIQIEQQMAVEADPVIPQISDEASPDAEEKQISKETSACVAETQLSKEANADVIQIEQQMAVEADPDVAQTPLSKQTNTGETESEVSRVASLVLTESQSRAQDPTSAVTESVEKLGKTTCTVKDLMTPAIPGPSDDELSDNTFADKHTVVVKGRFDSIYRCKFCVGHQTSWTNEGSYRRHLQQHSPSWDIMCPCCNKRFKTRPILDIHLELCMEEHNFVCHICGQTFLNKSKFFYHQQNHQRQKNRKKGNFTCNICKRDFTTTYKLHRHTTAIHDDDVAPRYHCTKCPKSFSATLTLTNHMKDHGEEAVRRHKCAVCDSAFLYKHHLQNHIDSKHSSERRYKCDVCDKKFNLKHQLASHMRLHTGDLFKCDDCGCKSTSKAHLNIHIRNHHPEKAVFYTCKICKEDFTKLYVMNDHILKVHGKNESGSTGSGDRGPREGTLLRCDICDAKFTKKYYLSKHMKLKHSVGGSEEADVKKTSSKRKRVSKMDEDGASLDAGVKKKSSKKKTVNKTGAVDANSETEAPEKSKKRRSTGEKTCRTQKRQSKRKRKGIVQDSSSNTSEGEEENNAFEREVKERLCKEKRKVIEWCSSGESPEEGDEEVEKKSKRGRKGKKQRIA